MKFPGIALPQRIRILKHLLLAIATALAAGWLATPARADGIVPADDTEQSLLDVLAGGEAGTTNLVTFEGDDSITLSSPIVISNDTTIDATGVNVTIDGTNQWRVFEVASNVNVTLINLTITGGSSSNGGALYVHPGATVMLTNCMLIGNGAFTGAATNTTTFLTNVITTNVSTYVTNFVVTNLFVYTNFQNQLLTNTTLFTNGNFGLEVFSVPFAYVNIFGSNTTYVASYTNILGTNLSFFTNSLTVTNMTLSNAGANGSDSPSGNGGNGRNGLASKPALGGAIFNHGALTLLNCTLSTNNATGGDGGSGGNGGNGGGELSRGGYGGGGGAGGSAYGGAIYNLGTLLLDSCSVSNNSASGGNGETGGTGGTGFTAGLAGSGGAGGAGSGGGVYSSNQIVVRNCTFSGNTAQGGGSANGGTAVNGNGVKGRDGASSFGGGICALGSAQVIGRVTNCTFFDDTATGGSGGSGGAGRRNAGAGGNGGTGAGGGLYHAGSTITVVNCTFSTCGAFGGSNGVAGSGLSPAANGHPGGAHGGNIANGSGKFSLMNSIIDTNLAGGGAYGRIIDAGYNIIADRSIALVKGKNSKLKTDPQLEPLADNGGRTETMALPAGSPASTNVPAKYCPETDQRGMVLQPGNCACGAYQPAVIAAPSITSQPQSQTNIVGSSVTFTVGVSSDAPLSYQWQFNTVSNLTTANKIPLATNSSYTINPLTTNASGWYDVVVSSAGLSTTSALAALTVVVPPAIGSLTVLPTNTMVVIGSSATLSVSATGTLPLSYQWRLNGTNVAGATFFTLPITNTVLGTASYDAIISNSGGSVTSAPVVLDIMPGFTISGRVFDWTGAGLPGAHVDASGTSMVGFDAPTASDGSFMLTNLPAGTYVLTAAYSCYPFSPSSNSVPVATNMVGVNFIELASGITGQISKGANALSGVTVTISGAGTTTNVTTTNGSYSVSGLCPGAYAITPAQSCLLFQPPSISLTLAPDTTNQASPFSAYDNNIFSISGRVTTDGTNGLAGVTVQAGSQTATTDTNGSYVISHVCVGTIEVMPSLTNYCFNPASSNVTILSADANNVDFLAVPGAYAISGTISNADGLDVIVIATGGGITKTAVLTNASYVISNLCPGAYLVTPSNACYQFYLPSRTVQVGPGLGSNVDFVVAYPDAFTIGGRITLGTNGAGVSGVTVTAAGQTNQSDASGNYVFSNLSCGNYSIIPALPGYAFEPSALPVSVGPSTNGLNFAAFLVAPVAAASLSSNTLALVYQGYTYLTYVVEYKTQLGDTNWISLSTNTPATNGPTTLLDSTTNATRFYRILVR